MAKLKIVGKANPISVSQHVAEKITKWKMDGLYEPTHLIDLGSDGFVELGQIKQIIPDDPYMLAEASAEEERTKKRQSDMQDWDEYVSRCIMESPEQKADRMIRSWCLLAYISRGNKPERDERNQLIIPKELADKLKMVLIDYFHENKNEKDCPKEEYINLIPKEGQTKVQRQMEKAVR